MRLIKFFLLFLSLAFFLFKGNSVIAEGVSESKVSCFDIYIVNDPYFSNKTDEGCNSECSGVINDVKGKKWDKSTQGQVWGNGQAAVRWNIWRDIGTGHTIMLKNKDQNAFNKDEKVYLLRQFNQIYCNPNTDGSLCVLQKDGNGNEIKTFCNPAIVTDEKLCHKEGESYVGPLYTKQELYWECATFEGGGYMCDDTKFKKLTDAIQFEVHAPGPTTEYALGGNSQLTILNDGLPTSTNPVADENGNLVFNHVLGYTLASMIQSYWGLQIGADVESGDTMAISRALKLATFTPVDNVSGGSVNCTTIHWDPYGRIIDAKTLEPIINAQVILKNFNFDNKLINTALPNNPLFANPVYTSIQGEFNFLVPEGTYFLFPSHPDFTYPTTEEQINKAIARLKLIDPDGLYIKTEKIYRNSSEAIIEKAGFPERRDIILQPKDPNYQGSPPLIFEASALREKGNQLIRGRVSHPMSLVRAISKNTILAETSADIDGSFSLTIQYTKIPSGVYMVQLIAEKVSLNESSVIQKKSPLYSVNLIPSFVSGFAYNKDGQIVPKAKVELVAMGGIVFAKDTADKDGFTSFNTTTLPPFDFKIRVKDETGGKILDTQTAREFQQINKPYLSLTEVNLYGEPKSTNLEKPSVEIIEKIKKTPVNFNQIRLSINPTQQPNQGNTTNTTTKNNLFFFLAMFIVIALPIGGFIVLSQLKKSNSVIQ